MIAKILLPLLLIVSAVAGEAIDDICTQLSTQLNLLESLVPLEIDVIFPHESSIYISGPAKYRIASELVFPNSACSVKTMSEDGTSRRVSITVKSEKSYVIAPTKVLFIYGGAFTLVLDVEEAQSGSVKKVTVNDLIFTHQNIFEDIMMSSYNYKKYIEDNLVKSILKELQQKMNINFDLDKRVEMNTGLIRELMQSVYRATAQDF
ncbi:uncharacterized protein [Halyomorpha halys]|uniref:uncharacterized protein n=1 Tax=Halyomorpha halys TaxID=286706 RepID=UPI0006D4F58C|nr:uncharacterized protein LOC106691513 [Halyomorpha halys]